MVFKINSSVPSVNKLSVMYSAPLQNTGDRTVDRQTDLRSSGSLVDWRSSLQVV